MPFEDIEKDFKMKVCEQVSLFKEGIDRFRVFTPFLFEDGDHLVIVLKRKDDQWVLTDEGHTYMHMTYDIDEKDLHRGTRQIIISNALSAFEMEDLEGELILPIKSGEFGDSLYSFAQGLLKITDISYLSRERVRSTFLEDFKQLLGESVVEQRRIFDWSEPDYDPQKRYTVDCRVNGMQRPLYIFALSSDGRVRDATIAMLQFKEWGLNFKTLGIFKDRENINGKVLARFSDVCENQFPNLISNRERIQNFISEVISEGN